MVPTLPSRLGICTEGRRVKGVMLICDETFGIHHVNLNTGQVVLQRENHLCGLFKEGQESAKSLPWAVTPNGEVFEGIIHRTPEESVEYMVKLMGYKTQLTNPILSATTEGELCILANGRGLRLTTYQHAIAQAYLPTVREFEYDPRTPPTPLAFHSLYWEGGSHPTLLACGLRLSSIMKAIDSMNFLVADPLAQDEADPDLINLPTTIAKLYNKFEEEASWKNRR